MVLLGQKEQVRLQNARGSSSISVTFRLKRVRLPASSKP